MKTEEGKFGFSIQHDTEGFFIKKNNENLEIKICYDTPKTLQRRRMLHAIERAYILGIKKGRRQTVNKVVDLFPTTKETVKTLLMEILNNET